MPSTRTGGFRHSKPVTDTQIIDRLTADAKRLTTNLDVAVKGEEAARKETAMIRNKAIVQTHGEATGI